MFFVSLILTLSDSTNVSIKKESIEDKWQFYAKCDLGSYTKFKLRDINREISINKTASPLATTAFTIDISVQKDKKSLSFEMFAISTEARGLFHSSQLDTEQIEFGPFNLIGSYKTGLTKQIVILPQIGITYTCWEQYRVLTSSKVQKKNGKGNLGVLGGTNIRLQNVSENSHIIPFIEGKYQYLTPFEGVNRILVRAGITWINFILWGNTEKERENGRCARVDIDFFKGYTFGSSIESQDYGIGLKMWFLPKIWNYEWW